MFKGHWIVADMDGTLVPTPSAAGGRYLPLRTSPCHGPLANFIAHGGSLCVVSTAGKRMWAQVFEDLKGTLFSRKTAASSAAAGRLLICGFSGAALFMSDAQTEAMHEVVAYRETGGTNGGPTVLPTEFAAPAPSSKKAGVTTKVIDVVNLVTGLCTDVVYDFFEAAAEDPTLIPTLSMKYHEPYARVLQEATSLRMKEVKKIKKKLDSYPPHVRAEVRENIIHAEPTLRECLEHVMPLEQLTAHGAVLSETNDAILDLQTIPTATTDGDGGDESTVADDDSAPAAVVAQVTVMGIPMVHFDKFFRAPIVAQLDAVGLYCKRQPNSVVIARKGVDKASCVRWLVSHQDELEFSLEKSVAMGDIPATIDKPLTQFPPMKFVSVELEKTKRLPGDASSAPAPTTAEPSSNILYVGEEERGSALFLTRLIDESTTSSAAGACAVWTERLLANAAAAAAVDARAAAAEAEKRDAHQADYFTGHKL